MESYSKKNLNIAMAVAIFSIIIGLMGWWLTRSQIFINISFILLGLNSIYFSHDLAMERVVKYKLNYKFARGAYIVTGLVFVLGNIILLIKG